MSDGYDDSRSAGEIGERALVVGYVLSAFKPAGLESHHFDALIVAVKHALSAGDKELLFRGHWSHEVQQELFWQCESLHVLLWGAGRHDRLLPLDHQVSSQAVIEELNAMGRDVSAWLASLVRRPDAELSAANELIDFWLWRVRDGVLGGGSLSRAARDAIAGAVARGVLSEKQLREGDVVAFGRPFHRLPRPQQQQVASIVTERTRAIRWIWKDFEDWWNPNLDS